MNRLAGVAVLVLASAGLVTACGASSSSTGVGVETSAGSSPGASSVKSSPSGSTPSSSPAATAPTAYKNVSAAAAKSLESKLPTMRGVFSDTYYPDTKVFQVYFKPSATPAERSAVAQQVISATQS
jgi:hypothetical protein